ncbi:MAG: hypothetical protein U5L00_02410 [Desulfovermiculus sp.]|nr:hypothetical protein [Desulfovermiculus sp.]
MHLPLELVGFKIYTEIAENFPIASGSDEFFYFPQDVMYCKETVTCSHKGCLRETTYCISLYSREKISRMLQEVGFTDILFQEDFMDRQEIGDYGTI